MVTRKSLSPAKLYDTDVSDEQWELICDLVPSVQSNKKTGGRPPKYTRRDIFNAILYVTRTGCQWRLLPNDLPHWNTVHKYFCAWHDSGVFERINARLRERKRIRKGKQSTPTCAIIDSQSVKVVANVGYSGFDGGKKVNGRKRHIVVDTLGLLLAVKVHEASTQDRATAKDIIVKVKSVYKRIKIVFADQGYTGAVIQEIRAACRVTLEIVKRTDSKKFHVLPKRWIVERTFSWFGFYRRLAKDYERYPKHSEAFVYLAMSTIMLNRL